MHKQEIRKFELPELSLRQESNVFQETVEIPENIEKQEKYENSISFADHNAINEVGNIIPDEPINPNLITITKDELTFLIEQGKKSALDDYIASIQDVKKENDNQQNKEIENIHRIAREIKDRFEIEIEDVFSRILILAYSIASKIMNVSLMSISEQEFLKLIQSRIKDLNFNSNVAVEVKNESVAAILRQNGIEVSVNDDMLSMDYKIVWCNGFFERNAEDIANQIENILMNHKKIEK